MRKIYLLLFINSVGSLAIAQKTNLAPSVPVIDDYHGIKVVDEYRNLEDLKNPATINWMKSQTDYANAILKDLPYKEEFIRERIKFDQRKGYTVSNLKITGNDLYFYLKKGAEEKIAKLYYKKGAKGKEELLYNPDYFISSFDPDSKMKHSFGINYISPNWDGSKIVVSVSENGKEISEVIVIDVKSKNVYPQIITNTEPASIGGIKWLGDNTGFFYVYFPVTDLNAPDFLKNSQSVLYKIGDDPKNINQVFSNFNNPELKIDEGKYPGILAYNQNDNYYIGKLGDVDNYNDTFIIHKNDLKKGIKSWKPFYNKRDKVYLSKSAGNTTVFLSGFNSPNFKLCRTNTENPDFINPEILVPEKKDEVFQDFVITKDGIYYTTTKNGVDAKLYLYKNGREIPIVLPYVSGSIDLQTKGTDSSDLWISCEGWAHEAQRYKYDLATNQFRTENLVPTIEYPEFKNIIVEEITVKSRDQEDVPLTLIYDKNLKKNGEVPVLIDTYGGYGISSTPFFAKSYLMWAKAGGVMAIAHVRGGGEKGEKWHLAGYKETKPNSWRDLIDCTEYLIKEGYTSKNKVAIWGASAGGITIGRAMTERPDLFKVAIINVGLTNTLRSEITPNGPGNIAELGTVEKPEEFKSLLEMDAFHHIKDGVKYPATLITAGINDERVISWIPAKFAAKLIKKNISENPIFLKVDYEGGHGGEVPVAQIYANLGEIYAFALWQLGHPDYQPKN
ncbi:prolyl oligopeptidase family serine peptidase [Elizabethkingia ursingii]|uniref:prolyl oligopeptidase family serine peptidase n=1 Tax=Elizabethkingia ursingii TaxID=1756150 RepID=UPI0020122F4A|nr:prolyl oligopeptidase family serine peptidase [Elizabethkingia ursingii]MCL1667345.1 prolyl oligopeptidase family serine peptidase [Elizabethkingia ursingii]